VRITKIGSFCLKCSGGNRKSRLWCPVTTCDFWEIRFGKQPRTIAEQYSPVLVDRKLFEAIVGDRPEYELPSSLKAAAARTRALSRNIIFM